MTPAQAIQTCLAKSFRFSGRAGRSEYWWYVAFWLIGMQLAGFLVSFAIAFYYGVKAGVAGGAMLPAQSQTATTFGMFALWGVYALLAPAALSVSARRLHDSGRSAKLLWLFAAFIIVACTIPAFLAFQNGADAKTIGFAFGWWFPIALILSPLSLFWWTFRPSQPGPNPYDLNRIEVFT